MSSFDNKKELRFVITLGNGQTFQGGSSNQITLEGYRAIVNIDRGGGMMAGTLHAQIYGVTQSDMNACVTYPYQPQRLADGYVFSNIKVFAIDGAQETLIFTGNEYGNGRNRIYSFVRGGRYQHLQIFDLELNGHRGRSAVSANPRNADCDRFADEVRAAADG